MKNNYKKYRHTLRNSTSKSIQVCNVAQKVEFAFTVTEKIKI